MDPVTHTMVGAALADTGLKKHTPLAATTLMLAANAPDVDILAQFGGPYVGLAWRRGITHGLPALVVLPFVVLGVVLAIDRLIRWRRPSNPPVRPGPVLALAFLGVLTHPALDWLNTYGMRWLMPMDGRWFYGDALFIVDPWLWLALGGTLFLLHSRRISATLAWAALGAAMSYLILLQPIVPGPGKALWAAGLAGLVAVRLTREVEGTRLARVALGGAALYIVGMIALDAAAERQVRIALDAEGITDISGIMVGPEPANPFSGSVIVATPRSYHLGDFRWLESPRVTFHRSLAIEPWSPAIEAASLTEDARNFLVWSRFPFHEVEETSDGWVVRIGDARYLGRVGAGSLAGVTVRLDRDLQPR